MFVRKTVKLKYYIILIDPTKVDEYRKEMGLEPLSEYMDYMTQEQQKTIER